MACLSEVAKWFDVFLSNPRSGEVCVLLGEGMSRSGEKSSPKRDVCGEATISHSLRRDGVT